MNTKYQARHSSGYVMPVLFDSATSACCFIVSKPDPANWSWHAVAAPRAEDVKVPNLNNGWRDDELFNLIVGMTRDHARNLLDELIAREGL